ncbi:hypothetical protein HDU98_007658 [Podochytrium sp. JEL0797]|nr:hypothetical protein HDU98_007658 [Podochytrium sp. JEL0797]
MRNADSGHLGLIISAGLLTAGYAYFVRYGPVFDWKHKLFGISPPPPEAFEVSGFTAEGFETLKTVMQKAFIDGDDLGAQFAAYVDGKLVVDIAGGFTDRSYKTRYTTNTLQQVFSSSKFMSSAVFLHLVNTNRLCLDDPVVKYWPEFGEGGKEDVTVGQLLQHRGGVAFLDPERVPTPEDLLNLDLLASKIAEQPHNFEGKQVSAYHAHTRGWYLNEIARRATSGKSMRWIVYNEILPILNNRNTLLGVPNRGGEYPFEFHYGIPDTPLPLASSVKSRVSQLDSASFLYRMFHVFLPTRILLMLPGSHFPVPQSSINAYFFRNTPSSKALIGSGPDFTNRETEFPWCFNDAVTQKGQSPSSNGFTNARSLAKLADVVRRSQTNEKGLVASAETGLLSKRVFDEGYVSSSMEYDLILKRPFVYDAVGMGVFDQGFGFGDRGEAAKEYTFHGWSGSGGSIVMFELEHGISFAYTMNFAHLGSIGDFRSWRLIDELLRITKKLGETGGKDGI